MKKSWLILLMVILVILAGELIFIRPANAVTVNFQWTGSTGYLAKGSFSYDEKKAPVTFSENGDGETNILQSLTIAFYTPSGKQIAVYDDVVNGVSLAHYFQFNFNTVTQQIFGAIDVGGETADEIYLKGTVEQNLSLFQVEKSGLEQIIDADSGSLAASLKNAESPYFKVLKQF